MSESSSLSAQRALSAKWRALAARSPLGDAEILIDCADELDALPAIPDVRQWAPIETAPERRKVLVTWINALGKRRTALAMFHPAGTLELDEAPEDMLNEDGTNAEAGWWECREAGDAEDWHLNEKLTHWQPAPTTSELDTALAGGQQ